MRPPILAIFWLAFSLFISSNSAHAWSTYLELGSGLGHLSNGNSFFGVTGAESSNYGFAGAFSFYVPVTSPKNFFHFELGLQNRMTFVSIDSPKTDLGKISPHLAARFEFFRYYVGAGYSAFSLATTDGLLAFKPKAGATAFFFEGGIIWRIVPELQIAATYATERSVSSTMSSSEYGLRFRFPLSPYSNKDDKSVDFDGFRYPFGVMK